MHFPLSLEIGGLAISSHAICEVAAYIAGFLLLRRERARHGDVLDADARWTMCVAVLFGAIVGSKLVNWAGDPSKFAAHFREPSFWIGGKSVVGGLLGGMLAVELVKARYGITRRTGDALVLPLVVSIAIGRVGCFLWGLSDETYGTATSLPWGIDFGDGVARHPTQLYEIGFLALLGLALTRPGIRAWPEGARFDAFLFAYLAFRLAIDFLKPYQRFPDAIGLAATQWACVLGMGWRALWLQRRTRTLASGVSP